MIDLHSHVLPGIDDGPESIEESIELVRAAAASGTRTMVATPHVSGRYPNIASTISRLTGELNERLARDGIPVDIRAGAEIAMTQVDELAPHDLCALHLGDGPWVLLEPPFSSVATGLARIVERLQDAGHSVLLAHPERCPALLREPRMVESLVENGVLTSVTAASLIGRFGGEPARFARLLFERGLVHNVASDTHDAIKRPPGMADALERAGLDELADWLTGEVPGAILAGEEIPDPPPVQLTKRSWWRGGSRLKRAW